MRRKFVWAVLVCCTAYTFAFGQDVQQLQDRVQQLEKETQELKARLAAIDNFLEKSKLPQPAENRPVVRPTVLVNSPDTTATAVPNTLPVESTLPATSSTTNEASLNTPTIASAPPAAAGQETPPATETKPEMNIYGFAMLDLGYDFGQNDPAWFDTMRPTKLPAFRNQFGGDGRTYAGVRQSRFGVKSTVPTKFGDLKTIFEFEMFGTGVDAGQTTFRLRHAWGELKHIGAGQTWSPFMDPDVFPNSLEYWGPNGMVFFRNVQLRWMPVNDGNHQIWLALERPGASADPGSLGGRIELQNVTGRFPAPDVSGRIRWGNERSYFQVAGIGRYIAWDDTSTAAINLSGHAWGWGTNLSSNIGVGKKDTLRLSVTYGEGIENYMNDAPVDVAPRFNPANLLRPINGIPLPVFGMVAFYDHNWSERWTTSIGYSMLNIQNENLQEPSAFHRGQYGLTNLLFNPVKNVMMGAELQWGRRQNFTDGWEYDDYRVQMGFRYNFDFKVLGEKNK
jgi:hypothetical protein